MINLTIFLSGCAQKTISVVNPPFPLPSDEVANELVRQCIPKENCPALWDWINDLYKLKDQLEN